MAETTKDKDTTDETPARGSRTPPQSDSAPAAEQFAVSDLIARSDGFLGQASYVVAAALHGRTADITLDDAQNAVATWLSEPVQKEA